MALNPPIIDNAVPAFYQEKEQDTILRVPFKLPRSVGFSDVKGLCLIIKTANTGKYIDTIYSNNYKINNIATREAEAIFVIDSHINFMVGQYYKIQIAFSESNNIVSEYSYAAAIKCTTKPTISINNLTDEINAYQREYIGKYENEDVTEKVVIYRFSLYDNTGELVVDSGNLLHNTQNDVTNYSSFDNWNIENVLKTNTPYSIEYSIVTNNGLIEKSPRYTIFKGEGIDANANLTLKSEYDINNAIVTLNIVNNSEEAAFGYYILLRSTNENDWQTWEEINRFELTGLLKNQNKKLCIDKTIAHGYQYKYAIQRYNQYNIYSNLIESTNIITGEFEDMYLSDETCQLKIRFNPKVNNFKNTILETKTETVGGQHPTFYRNALTKYKEFSISGLISILTDPDELFLSGLLQNDIHDRISTPAASDIPVAEASTQLVATNIDNERKFKLRVLEWLSNGKPKLFRSATEGNYIVRLMNVSLSPNDTLGRMLHSFTANAYEIETYSFDNLQKYFFISQSHINVCEPVELTIELSGQETIALPQQLMQISLHTIPHFSFIYYTTSENNIQAMTNISGQFILPTNTINIQPKTDWPIGSKLSLMYQPSAQNNDSFESITKITYQLVHNKISAEEANINCLPLGATAIYLKITPTQKDAVCIVELDDKVITSNSEIAFTNADLYGVSKIIIHVGTTGEIYYIGQIKES